MKIVQVISSLTGRGAERVCVELHELFIASGHDSHIYITHNEVDYDTNINIEFIEANDILVKLKNESFDIIIGHMTHAAKVLRHIKHHKNVFFVVHTTLSKKLEQEKLLNKIESYIKLQLVYRNSNIICVSDWVKNDITKVLKIKPKTIQTIYNPFDFNRIKKLGNELIDIKFEYIIAVGSLHKVKRLDLLLKAYAKLNTNLKLVILGKGNEEKNLKNLTKKLGLEEKVYFLGWVKNPYKYIKNAKLLVLSSDIEGLPSVVIESLILNTPVVSTDCPSGIREIISNIDLLSKVGDVEDLSIKIENALSNYPIIDNNNLKKFESDNILKKYLNLI
jgi:glycosyltransferase involved in cell wall biosynthesis